MIAATLFSGIGAPETAMPEWRWAWSAEIEKFPSAVLAARHPDSINLGNVAADGFAEKAGDIANPDVLIFGSPCQSYSVVGRRLGLDDPRGNLALVALGIVDRLKPRWFVFENVPGLLSSSEGRDFGIFLRTVDELGYFGAWAGLDAQYRGLAQRRDRVFFVGNSRDWRDSAAVLFEPESLCGHYPPRREAGKGIAPTIASRPTGGGGLGTDFDCDGGLIAGALGTRSAAHPSGTAHEADFMVASTGDVAHCLNAGGMGRQDYETETVIAHALRADGFDASEDGTGRGTPLISAPPLAFDCKASGRNGFGVGDITSTLRAMNSNKNHHNAGGHLAVAFSITPSNSNKDYNAREVERTQALTGSANRPSARGGDLITRSSTVRRLTPRECERLQGFPDDYTAITYRNKIAADGPRYKALGNSMAVPIMRFILSRIEQISYS